MTGYTRDLPPPGSTRCNSTRRPFAASLGASAESIGANGPGSFSGPFVASGQALAVLVVLGGLFAATASTLLRRRDVT